MRKETTSGWQRAIENGTRWTATDAAAALAACARSGESIIAFAQRHRMVPNRLYWWRQRLEKEGVAAAERRDARLIPVTVRPAALESRGDAEVVVIDGELRVEVGSPNAVSAAWVAMVVRLVREGGA